MYKMSTHNNLSDNISDLAMLTNYYDTFIPIRAGDGNLIGALHVPTSPVSSTLPHDKNLRRLRLYQDATGTQFTGMPTVLQNKTCILYRSVLYATTGHALVRMEEGYPVAGRIWTNFYNYGTWTGWKCTTPS